MGSVACDLFELVLPRAFFVVFPVAVSTAIPPRPRSMVDDHDDSINELPPSHADDSLWKTEKFNVVIFVKISHGLSDENGRTRKTHQ